MTAIPSVIRAMNDPRTLQTLAMTQWDFALTLTSAKWCLRKHAGEIARILRTWRRHDSCGSWANENTIGCWLRLRAVEYRDKRAPCERPKINPHRVNYAIDDGVHVLYHITSLPIGADDVDANPSFDDAVRTLEEKRARLMWNEVIG